MTPRITEDIEQVVEENCGLVHAQGRDSTYVIMTTQRFRELMGVGSDEDYAESLEAVREGIADMEAGRTQPADEFFREFDEENGIPS